MVKISDWDEINNPNCVKVIVNKENFAQYFSRAAIPFARDKDVVTSYYKHKGIYAFTKQALLDFYHLPMGTLEAIEKIECLRYLEYGKNIKMVETSIDGVGIDTPEDLVKANAILKNKQH